MINELMIRVTYKCNKNCEFCFNNIFEDKVDHNTEECLDITEIEKFVKRNTVEVIHISGGEPTVYEDIQNLTKAMSTLGKVFYFTNGLLFEKFSDEEISAMEMSAINISIYTGEMIRCNNGFEDKCQRLKRFKNKYPNINLNAQIMIDDTFFEVIKSKGFKMIETFFDRINWQPLAIPKGHHLYRRTLEGMDRKTAEDILNYLDNIEDSKKVITLKNILDGNIDEPCLMGSKYITLNPDMTISVCPHKNNERLSIEEFDSIKHTIDNSNKKCLSLRCVSLQSYLNKKYLKTN